MGNAISKSVSGNSPVPVSATSTRYRPRDYFGRYDLQTELLTQVKGTMRRKALREALEEGLIMQVPDAVKGSALSEVAAPNCERRQGSVCKQKSFRMEAAPAS